MEVHYIFRNEYVMTYDTKSSGGLIIYAKAEHCKFISEDLLLMSKWLDNCYQHSTGVLHESFLKTVEVV